MPPDVGKNAQGRPAQVSGAYTGQRRFRRQREEGRPLDEVAQPGRILLLAAEREILVAFKTKDFVPNAIGHIALGKLTVLGEGVERRFEPSGEHGLGAEAGEVLAPLQPPFDIPDTGQCCAEQRKKQRDTPAC